MYKKTVKNLEHAETLIQKAVETDNFDNESEVSINNRSSSSSSDDGCISEKNGGIQVFYFMNVVL